ncbi:MAG: hypothetical protein COU33_00735 [Candidatus Magasanikbacteria bacterium CG10_big_fil_rev_8_21_14_0_10_43_6]|uniref:Uncharacterized protein n=1 Tax=Candidatus Magasanikbacteria bacterium CG10_big_fil_rev_8_21_14_0_10_43_6 TaxID=1974650 RepID=A0A2M6W245_9BACT|nr:MAG: hypothetical protein COU33_00735 [Candidatus Magasanikbacteria bacterium CG10_big_fil_rev_8_21_14_0_10_43_6]
MLKKFHSLKKKHRVPFAILIGFSVILFWRGAWGILDVYLFPDNYALSSIVSLGLGLLGATHYIVNELM